MPRLTSAIASLTTIVLLATCSEPPPPEAAFGSHGKRNPMMGTSVISRS